MAIGFNIRKILRKIFLCLLQKLLAMLDLLAPCQKIGLFYG